MLKLITSPSPISQGNEIIRVKRPFRCNNILCCPCLNQTMSIEFPVGVEVGSIEQKLSLCNPKFEITDAEGDVKYIVEGIHHA